jgi:hypothetical protein
MSQEATILSLLHRLAQAGIWLQRKADGSLIAGPTSVVNVYPALLAQVRTHKGAISQLIAQQLVHDLFGAGGDSHPEFATAVCPICAQRIYVIAPDDGEHYSTRRLAVHRRPDGTTVCPGGGRAALDEVAHILTAFLTARCLTRPSAVLSWLSLWTAFRSWCYATKMLPLPAPAALQEAMNTRFPVQEYPQGLAWGGVTLVQQEWWGDLQEKSESGDDPRPTPQQDARHQQLRLVSAW